jgi:DNA-binding winged helix-turn-helix (wHTH) protein
VNADASRHVYRFGLYEADLRSGELRKNGVKLKIQGQPFEVLVALLERPNQVVTREEIRQRLWPSDTFVDFDHGLNTAINKVRDVLGDTAANPRFLETLPKRGYRFIAPVQEVSEKPVANAGHDTTQGAAVDADVATPVPAVAPTPSSVDDQELPPVNRTLGRSLFLLIQVMYLCFYVVALARVSEGVVGSWWLMIAIIVSAVIGIPMRLYLLTAVAFDYRKLGANFQRLWPAVLFFDLLWALAPFLLANRIGFGLAFGACAALLYVPFSQRTLVRMTYAR